MSLRPRRTASGVGLALPVVTLLLATGCSGEGRAPGGRDARDAADAPGPPRFLAAQPELFSADGAQPNAWVDHDGDGDLDLYVGFRGRANRLYRNDGGHFEDVADRVGLAAPEETRAAAWGDWDGDGDLDLYVGFPAAGGVPDRLYRNDGGTFVDVAPDVGVAHVGTTRQPAFIDYDGDGDVDLFVALRDQPNRMYRNDGGVFTDVTGPSGLGDPRRTVGAVCFDMEGDGDPDLFVANQNGDEDGFFRNLGGGRFADVAPALGMHAPDRTEEQGGVGVAVADHDNDGDLDLFVAQYGPDALWRNQGDGTFRDVAPGTPLAGDHHSVGAAWGDYGGDGWVDLFVGTFLSGEPEAPDHLFRNDRGRFVDVTPPEILERGASHGVAWADFDGDGDVDLALANNAPGVGRHPLYTNAATAPGASLQVRVVDASGRAVRAGATVVVWEEAGGGAPGFVTARVVDGGGGYASQGAAPVHVGLPAGMARVSVTVVWSEGGARRQVRVDGIEPARLRGRVLVVGPDGRVDATTGDRRRAPP